LKRFIARRGLNRAIYSDKAMTFKREDQYLKELWKSIKEPNLRILFTERGITWKNLVEQPGGVGSRNIL